MMFARRCPFRPPAGDTLRVGNPSPSSAADAQQPDPRHERAAEAGRMKDLAWFRCHPDRSYRLRKSLPFEDHTWGAQDHKRFRFMAVYASPDGSDYRRHAIRADRRPGRNEEFIRRIFERIDNFEGDGLIIVSPDDHEADLRLAGDIQ